MISEKCIKIMICIGTRPEIIKMSPIINSVRSDVAFDSYIVLSGQHKELAISAINDLRVPVDSKYDVMRCNQPLSFLLAEMIKNFTEEMEKYKPDLVMIHGDTSTALAGALSAAYLHFPVFHIEAGLRTYSSVPFPEELHRRIITNCSSFFACPDRISANNLINEGVSSEKICITGNTIADVVCNTISQDYSFKNKILRLYNFENHKEIVVTLHRSETSENAIHNVCDALKRLVCDHKDVNVFWPVHPNPRIKSLVLSSLSNISNIHLLEPLSVKDMHNMLLRSSIVLTDSAGLQEEAFLMERPTIILRDTSERPAFFDSTVSKYLSPEDDELFFEIEKCLDYSSENTDYSIKSRLFTHAGATKRIISYIKRCCL